MGRSRTDSAQLGEITSNSHHYTQWYNLFPIFHLYFICKKLGHGPKILFIIACIFADISFKI